MKLPLLLSCLLFFASVSLADNKLPQAPGLTSIESDPSGIIDGCVNVISGQYFDCEVDLVVPGPQPLKVERLLQYNNPHPAAEKYDPSWTYGHEASLSLKAGSGDQYDAYFTKGLETPTRFRIKKNKKKHTVAAAPDLKQFLNGITNCSSGTIGARSNPKNRELNWLYDFEYLFLRMEDGTNLRFDGKYGGNLAQESFPNGLYLLYQYHDHKLDQITLKNSQKKELAHYKIERSKNSLQKVVSSDGRTVNYTIDEKKNKSGSYLKILEVNRPNAPTITYSYYPARSYPDAPPSNLYPNGGYDENEKMQRKSYPDNRYKEVVYVATEPAQAHFRRTSHLLAPVGRDASPHVKYRFDYYLPDHLNGAGCTGVYDALGHKTDYDFNQQQRLTSIKKYFADGTPYTKESLYWEGMELHARSFKVLNDPYHLFARQHIYDNKGNILEDHLCGNICGKNKSTLHVDENGNISGNYDRLIKTYQYSQDNYNLLTEATVGPLRQTFHYKPKSNLLEACFHHDEKGIFLRHFYAYDDNALMIQHIIDDGSGTSVEDFSSVTERKIERIKRSDTFPHGLPKIVSEYYVDPKTKKEVLYLKKINTHDGLGRLTHQETYGSDGQFAYSESWTYDDHGNTRTETNRLGQVIIRDFDDNDNMIYQRGVDTRLEHRFKYDFMNRLIQIDETHPDGTLSKHYLYDDCGNPTATIDVLGNETTTEYDPFNRPIRVIGAPLVDAEEQVYRPVTNYEYDALSNPIKLIDPEGHATEFTYTILGKPCLISHPDGAQEHFEYDLEGRLIKETAKDGVQTNYTYDAQGRNTKKEVFSKRGDFLFKTEARYNTFHLLEEIDAAGTVTSYSYDLIGRKISAVKSGIITTYDYDTLGRVVKTTLGGTATSVLFDNMDRVIEERIENCQGILTYKKYYYDDAGNQYKIDSGGSVTFMEYDTHGIPVKITDPEGNVSLNRLILNYDSHGLNVFAIERTDSTGVVSLSIQDTHGQVVETRKTDPFGNTLQKTVHQKNASGRCTATLETEYYANNPIRIIKNCFEYDSAGRHVATIQAAGTPDEKKSSVQFNKLGQKTSSTKPNGDTILYHYDPMGRLKQVYSPDGSVSYLYTYDICGNPIKVENLVDKNTTFRTYDLHHRTIKEILANSLSTQMTYTPEGYLKDLTLPDTSSIHYTYEGPLLKQIDRIKDQGIAYSHKYHTHDHSGRLLKSSLIHDLGELSHRFTPKGRISKISSPYYNEGMTYDAIGNLINRTYNDQEEQFSYDSLNQLSGEPGSTYTHDSLYNRRSKNGLEHNHNALNQLISDGETEFSYDLNGNLIKEIRKNSTRTFNYDAQGRLKTLQIDHDRWEFFYDEQNRCISYKTQEQTEHILYVGQNDIGTSDSKGLHTLRILGKGLGAEIGAAVALELRGKTYAPIHDHRGNIAALIDPSGNTAATYNYTSFGEETTPSLFENPWGFSSKRRFGDYLLFGRRFYNPSQGRWLTPDPLGYQAGPNLYAYVSNNPQTHFDPHGLSEEGSSGYIDRITDFIDRTCDFFRSTWDSVRDTLSRGYESLREGVRSIFDGVRDATRTAGAGLKFVATNVILIPIVRDFGGGILGHFMENGTLRDYPWFWTLEKSQFVPGEGEHLSQKLRVVFENGINTTFAQFLKNLMHVSDIFGFRVYGAYNSTDCHTVDILETLIQKIGIPTHSVEVLVKTLKTCIQEVGGVGSDGMVLALAHSQGGEILFNALKQLTDEERNMIVVCTLGTARINISDGVRYAINYISDHDYVTRAGDPMHYKLARAGLIPEAILMKSEDPKLLDHDFMGKTYTKALGYFADYFYTNLWHP